MPYDDEKELKRRLYELISVRREADAKAGRGRFRGEHITRTEIDRAVNAAWEADLEFKQTMRRKGDETLAWMEAHDATASCWRADPTTTTQRSTTPSPSS